MYKYKTPYELLLENKVEELTKAKEAIIKHYEAKLSHTRGLTVRSLPTEEQMKAAPREIYVKDLDQLATVSIDYLSGLDACHVIAKVKDGISLAYYVSRSELYDIRSQTNLLAHLHERFVERLLTFLHNEPDYKLYSRTL